MLICISQRRVLNTDNIAIINNHGSGRLSATLVHGNQIQLTRCVDEDWELIMSKVDCAVKEEAEPLPGSKGELKQLRDRCIELGFKPHKNHGADTMRKMITAKEEQLEEAKRKE